MTRDTALFLLQILGQTNISAGSPDFETTAASIVQARKELEAAASE